MRQYSAVHAIFMSFFSPELYRDVARNWRGTGFAYLFLVIFLSWIPLTLQGHYELRSFISNKLPIHVQQMPQINIKDGELSINRPVPYYIQDPDSHKQKPFIVIDTSGKIKNLKQSNAEIFISKTSLHMRDDETGETHEIIFAEHEGLRNLEITHEKINGWIKQYSGKWLMIGCVIFFFIIVIACYIYRIIQALIYSLIAMIFASIMKARKDFDVLLRLCVVAVTPAILLSMVLSLLSINLPSIVYLVVSILYIGIAVGANKNTA